MTFRRTWASFRENHILVAILSSSGIYPTTRPAKVVILHLYVFMHVAAVTIALDPNLGKYSGPPACAGVQGHCLGLVELNGEAWSYAFGSAAAVLPVAHLLLMYWRGKTFEERAEQLPPEQREQLYMELFVDKVYWWRTKLSVFGFVVLALILGDAWHIVYVLFTFTTGLRMDYVVYPDGRSPTEISWPEYERFEHDAAESGPFQVSVLLDSRTVFYLRFVAASVMAHLIVLLPVAILIHQAIGAPRLSQTLNVVIGGPIRWVCKVFKRLVVQPVQEHLWERKIAKQTKIKRVRSTDAGDSRLSSADMHSRQGARPGMGD